MSRKTANYNQETVVAQLNKKNDVFIPSEENVIYIKREPAASHDIGIKSKGKIDFLLHYCGFVAQFLTSFK